MACALGIASYAVVALLQPPGADLRRHVSWFLVAFAFYLGAVSVLLRMHRGKPGGDSLRWDLAIILGGALVFRLLLLATTPSLSDDLFRYVWDGRVMNAGINPYLYPPAAPELEALRTPLWQGINHKSMVTPYPPLAELVFLVVYRLAPESLTAMQVMAVLFDLGVVVLLVFMVRFAGLDPRRVLIYAWNPLVLLQFAHSAHFDAAMILPLLGAIFLLGLGKRFVSGLLLGASTLIKVVPAMVAPLFLPLWGIAGLLPMGATAAAGVLGWSVAAGGAGGLLSEAGDARFNDSLGYLLPRLLAPAGPQADTIARLLAGGLLALSSLGLAALLWRRKAGWTQLMQATYWVIGLFVLLNAVVEPWYLTWIVPFLCFQLRATARGLPSLSPALGWLLLSGLVVLTDLSYLPQASGSQWVWIRAAEYGPLYLLLGLCAWRSLIERVQRAACWERLG